MKNYVFGVWLGFALAIVGFNITNWRFWFILLPTIILHFYLEVKEE